MTARDQMTRVIDDGAAVLCRIVEVGVSIKLVFERGTP